jgi:ribosomal protein L37AE/L43A
MTTKLKKLIKEYSPWFSNKEELESQGVDFSKCSSCGHQYPVQRFSKTSHYHCDQCKPNKRRKP